MRRIRLQYGTDGIELATDAPNVSVIEPRFVPGLAATRRPRSARRCARRSTPGPSGTRSAARSGRGGDPRHHAVVALRASPALALRRDLARPDRTDHHRQRHGLPPPEHARRARAHGRAGRWRRRTASSTTTRRTRRRWRSPGRPRTAARSPEPGVRRGRQADRAGLHRAPLHGGVLRAATRGSSRRWPTSTRSCTTTAPRSSPIPQSTWGVLEGNPTQAQIRANGALLPLHFCVNVTLNRRREITGFYCGDALEAHRRGCVEATSHDRLRAPFPSSSPPTAAIRSTRTSTRP